jgi:PEP-CTERM motif-containing protein
LDHHLNPDAASYYIGDRGTVIGLPGTGQTWQIGDPYLDGIHSTNAATGSLTNTIEANAQFPDTSTCCDIALALGQTFTLGASQTAILTFTAGATNPGGFTLEQSSVLSGNTSTVFFSSGLQIIGGEVPEPTSMALMAGGLLLIGISRLRKRKVSE